jgi:hypothetical protein
VVPAAYGHTALARSIGAVVVVVGALVWLGPVVVGEPVVCVALVVEGEPVLSSRVATIATTATAAITATPDATNHRRRSRFAVGGKVFIQPRR